MNIAQPIRKGRMPRSEPIRRGTPRVIKLLLGMIVTLLILAALPALATVGAYGYLEALEIILPGVEIGGVQLEGLAIHEASAKIDQVYNQDYQVIVVDTLDPSKSWVVSPLDFGLSVDHQASAAQAHAVGRAEGLVAGVEQMLADGWQGAPQVTFDPEIARATLERWAETVNVPHVEGNLVIDGGQVLQTQGSVGKSLDIEASLQLLSVNPSEVLLGYGFVPLVMVPVEPMIMDVTAPAAQVEAFLSSGLTLRAYDPVTDEHFTWTPGREVIASWLTVTRGEKQFSVTLEQGKVADFVAGLNELLGGERVFDIERAFADAKAGLTGVSSDTMLIQYLPREHVVQQSESLVSFSFRMGIPYWKLQEANAQLYGRGVVLGETITLPPQDAMLPLPVVMEKRIVISITEQNMWVYQGGEEIGDYVISTGMAGSPTMPGIFQVQSHFENAYASRWDLWMPNFLGIYEAAPGFLNGIHGLPMLSNGVRLWGSVLGQPASYGCIILDLESAESLFDWAEDGVVVEIRE